MAHIAQIGLAHKLTQHVTHCTDGPDTQYHTNYTTRIAQIDLVHNITPTWHTLHRSA